MGDGRPQPNADSDGDFGDGDRLYDDLGRNGAKQGQGGRRQLWGRLGGWPCSSFVVVVQVHACIGAWMPFGAHFGGALTGGTANEIESRNPGARITGAVSRAGSGRRQNGPVSSYSMVLEPAVLQMDLIEYTALGWVGLPKRLH